MKQKIENLLEKLNEGLVDREETIKTVLLAVLAGENPLLVGPPGTGKSLVARRIASVFSKEKNKEGSYFEYLLTKFSTPEEIFGPLSISALKNDRFQRNTAGYLPTVRVAFLDEVFKASSSILNSLLTLMNERIFHNGTEPQKAPLQSLIAASNELPTEQEELSALYDRFLVRLFVDYVDISKLESLFDETLELKLKVDELFSEVDLNTIINSVNTIDVPDRIKKVVQKIWTEHKEAFKEDRRENLSDRRLKKVIHLMKVSAFTNARDEVDLSDVFLLKDCLWNHPDNREKIRDIVIGILQKNSYFISVDETSIVAGELAYHEDAEFTVLYDDADKKDGSLIIVASQNSQKQEKGLVKRHVIGTMNAVVKGYKGSGTKEDPLLIESVEDLADLQRPEVGQQGYYFRQTCDIDCSSIKTWPSISFKGFYDGSGFQLKDNINKYLFLTVKNSSFLNINMDSINLARDISDSIIQYCTIRFSNLAYQANSCNIYFCIISAVKSQIITKATKCKFFSCSLSCTSEFIVREFSSSEISDCVIFFKNYINNDLPSNIYSIFHEISELKICNLCIHFDIVYTSNTNFGIICQSASNSSIENVIVRKFLLRFYHSHTPADFCISDIVASHENVSFTKNKILDSEVDYLKRVTSDGNGKNCKLMYKSSFEIIASEFFSKRYLENTIGWNFDAVWAWDDEKKQPMLQNVGVDSFSGVDKNVFDNDASVISEKDGTETIDALAEQIRNNIWL